MPPKPPAKKVAERQAMTHFFSPDRNAEKVAQKAQETLQLAENADRLRVRLAEYLGQFHKDSRNLMVLVIAAKATHAYLERRKFDRKRWSVIRKLVAEIHYFGIPMSKSLLYEIFIQKWKDSDDPNIDMSAYEWCVRLESCVRMEYLLNPFQ